MIYNFTNKKISKIGMGCFGIGGPFRGNDQFYAYGDVDDYESIKTVHKAIELGVTIFDTADVYGHGRSERVLGKALKDYRDDVLILTKFGSVFKDGWEAKGGKNTTREYILDAIEDSLKRLQTDYIDVYQLHNSRHDGEDLPRILEIMDQLIDDNKIRGFGWSTDNVSGIESIIDYKHLVSVQYASTILHRNPIMIDLIKNHNLLGFIRSPLASGSLTPKYRAPIDLPENHMLHGVDLQSERRLRTNEKMKRFDEIVTSDGRSVIQGLLGYVMSKSEKSIPIPGAKTVQQIVENAGTMDYGVLKPDQIKEIDELFDEIAQILYIPEKPAT